MLPPLSRPRSTEAEELLSDLLDVLFALPREAWSAVAPAVFPLRFSNGSIYFGWS